MDMIFRRVRFSVSVSVLITVLAGLSLTLLLFVSLRRIEVERHNVLAQQNAQLRATAVINGLDDAVEQVRVINQLFRTVGVVSREQFRVFTTPLLQRYPQIQALSFQRLVMHADRHAYEAAMRRTYPNFTITEMVDGKQQAAANRDRYTVIDYIEPSKGNEAALGLDTADTPAQAQARQRSRDSGQAVATGLQQLEQFKGWHTGFLVLAPVYWQGAPLDSSAARHRAVIGETAAVFRADHMIDSLLGTTAYLDAQGMNIRVYASPGADVKNLVFEHKSGEAAADLATDFSLLPGWLFYDAASPLIQNFNVTDTAWHIEIRHAPVSLIAAQHGSLFALLGGLLSTLLAAAYVWTLVSRTAIINRVTVERTAALQFANLRLSQDLAQHAHSQKTLHLHEQVIAVSANAIIICSAEAPDYLIEYVNPAFEQITGYSASEVIGRTLESLQGSNQDQQNIGEIRNALREKREGHALLRNYRKDGTGYWNDLFVAPVQDETGEISHFVVAQHDITAAMRYEAELEFQAKHDTLTGLANRNLLRERLEQAIANAKHHGKAIWVVFVDLDRFKFINDTLGHSAGDELLRVFAGRLQASVSEADTVARVGGDEFVILFPDPKTANPGLEMLQKIMDVVAQPLTIYEHEFFLTCSIGVAIFPDDGDTAETLTKHADIAMYRAKELGRNTFQFYTEAMSQRTLDRLSIEADLRHALEREEFLLQYQPQLDIKTGMVVGMEVLLRWQHPVHGMIEPARFIGLAEEMGLIIPIGAWVIRSACIQTRAWQLAGHDHLRVAVNISARQFTQKALVQSIADILQATGLEARYLELELTESMIMSDVDNTIEILRNLKGLGIHISIDDFGTGYSSLSYLRRFPIDVLKIDRSFVNDIDVDADDAAIVVSIISLAHSLRLQVIAEGVETASQLAFLRSYGCDQMQGYYFSRPLAAQAFEELLGAEKCLPGHEKQYEKKEEKQD